MLKEDETLQPGSVPYRELLVLHMFHMRSRLPLFFGFDLDLFRGLRFSYLVLPWIVAGSVCLGIAVVARLLR